MGLLHPREAVDTSRFKVKKYTGYVIKNTDDEKRQRVKIRVPQLHRGIPDEDLPWFAPQNTQQANAGPVGNVDVPNEGAKMYVVFDDDDPHMGYYTHTSTQEDANGQNELLQDSPNLRGRIDKFGNRFAVNEQTGDVEIVTAKKGTVIHVKGATGEVIIGGAQKVTLSGKADVTVTSDGTLNLHGRIVSIKADEAVKISPDPVPNGDPRKAPYATQERQTPTIPDRKNQTTL